MIHFEIRNFDHTANSLYLNHIYYSDQYIVKQYLIRHKNLNEVVSIIHLEDYQDHIMFSIYIDNNLKKLNQSKFYKSLYRYQRIIQVGTHTQKLPY